MAEPAARPQPQRGSQGVPVVRPLGNLPDRPNPDMGRAQSFLRARQKPMPMAPANDNGEADEEAPDEYGAAQRESEERMRDINQGEEVDTGTDEASDDYEQGFAQDEDEESSYGPDNRSLEQQRALELARQQALAANYAQQQAALGDEQDEERAEASQQQQIQQQLLAKKSTRNLIKLIEGVTVVGIILLVVQLNYEVFFEKDNPSWKIFLVLMMDMLLVMAFLATLLFPIIMFISVLAVGREFLPESVRGLFDSVISSVL